MIAAYHQREAMPRASFEMMVRRLPPDRNFLVLAGLEPALAALRSLQFSEPQIDYLRSLPTLGHLDDSFFEALRDFRFEGDVDAMEEGTVFFPSEPVLRVTGSLMEAQLVETLLLSIVNFQTAIASKAARVRLAAAEGVLLAEFGGRRAHGPHAAAWAARAAYLAGFDSTSNVLAGQRFGIPVVGTMAHSFVMSYEKEIEAFEAYQRLYPESCILLVDTYDTLQGVQHAIDLGTPLDGVRLDSGHLEELVPQVRSLLDRNGHRETRIFVSGDIDESRVRELREHGLPIDAYGVGTRVATSADAPYIGGVYKLVELLDGEDTRGVFKASPGKETFPGRKQVVRQLNEGRFDHDVLVSESRAGTYPEHQRLLVPHLRAGRSVRETSLEAGRERCRGQLAALPADLAGLEPTEPYRVEIDSGLTSDLERAQDERESRVDRPA
jgi:nicotinate phosphoribosyltransferase